MPGRYYPTYVSGDLPPDSGRVVAWLAAGEFQPLDTVTPTRARDGAGAPVYACLSGPLAAAFAGYR